MKIDEKSILSKEVVGKTDEGNPVLLVVTHGGLYAFFTKKENKIETLSMAPQVAIGAWMAEKKEKITWNEGFLKSEKYQYDNLRKSEGEMFKKLRKAMMSPLLKAECVKEEGYYYIYDTGTFDIGIMHKEDIKWGLRKGEISDLCLIRKLTLTEPICVIRNHREFGNG